MPAFFVVENFDVVENRRGGMDSRHEVFMENKFGFESREEALRHSVVPAVASPAHALDTVVMADRRSKEFAGVLATAI